MPSGSVSRTRVRRSSIFLARKSAARRADELYPALLRPVALGGDGEEVGPFGELVGVEKDRKDDIGRDAVFPGQAPELRVALEGRADEGGIDPGLAPGLEKGRKVAGIFVDLGPDDEPAAPEIHGPAAHSEGDGDDGEAHRQEDPQSHLVLVSHHDGLRRRRPWPRRLAPWIMGPPDIFGEFVGRLGEILSHGGGRGQEAVGRSAHRCGRWAR